ncbi:unnamed protein product, partial [Brenthis ino]
MLANRSACIKPVVRSHPAFHIHILPDDDDEDDEDEQQHEDAADGNGEHGRVFAQLGGAPCGATRRG